MTDRNELQDEADYFKRVAEERLTRIAELERERTLPVPRASEDEQKIGWSTSVIFFREITEKVREETDISDEQVELVVLALADLGYLRIR